MLQEYVTVFLFPVHEMFTVPSLLFRRLSRKDFSDHLTPMYQYDSVLISISGLLHDWPSLSLVGPCTDAVKNETEICKSPPLHPLTSTNLCFGRSPVGL